MTTHAEYIREANEWCDQMLIHIGRCLENQDRVMAVIDNPNDTEADDDENRGN